MGPIHWRIPFSYSEISPNSHCTILLMKCTNMNPQNPAGTDWNDQKKTHPLTTIVPLPWDLLLIPLFGAVDESVKPAVHTLNRCIRSWYRCSLWCPWIYPKSKIKQCVPLRTTTTSFICQVAFHPFHNIHTPPPTNDTTNTTSQGEKKTHKSLWLFIPSLIITFPGPIFLIGVSSTHACRDFKKLAHASYWLNASDWILNENSKRLSRQLGNYKITHREKTIYNLVHMDWDEASDGMSDDSPQSMCRALPSHRQVFDARPGGTAD